MKETLSPKRWAFDLTKLLNAAYGANRFPINVSTIALAYTAQRFPDDPIISVKGDNLPGFDGALFKAPAPHKGWRIIYNNRVQSKGRINFTLAHEFGHFLLHRFIYPKGFTCGEQDLIRWDSEYGQVEYQANVFAANFLMPLDDFRRQIPEKDCADFDMISHCANRYEVSLLAATLRWLSYTQKRAVLVVSRDGFILWARSSEAAFKTGMFFKTSSSPIEIPANSLPMKPEQLIGGRGIIEHDAGIWFQEAVCEMTIIAEQYDFAISLLLLEDETTFCSFGEEVERDVFDKMKYR